MTRRVQKWGEAVLDPLWRIDRRYPGFWKSLGLLVAAAFTLQQYLGHRHDERVSRTMDYVKRFEDGSVAEARHRLYGKVRRFLPTPTPFSNVSPADHQKILDTMLDADPSLADDLDTIVDFFEGLLLCVSEDICERSTAIGYFSSSETRLFRKNFKPYVEGRKRNNPQFAEGLDWFVKHGPGG